MKSGAASLAFAMTFIYQASAFARAGSAGAALDPADFLKVLKASNEPVSVVQMAFEEQLSVSSAKGASRRVGKVPDLNVEIVNRSNRPISYVLYSLDPPDRCPGWSHPMSTWVWYGRTEPAADAPLNKAEPPIDPGKSVQIVVKGQDLERIRDRSIKAKCRPQDRTELTIWKVAFTDGTGWEAFADGPNHDLWNGRPWTPPPPRPDSSDKAMKDKP